MRLAYCASLLSLLSESICLPSSGDLCRTGRSIFVAHNAASLAHTVGNGNDDPQDSRFILTGRCWFSLRLTG